MSPLAWLRSAQTQPLGSEAAVGESGPGDDAVSSLILGRLLITLGVLCACGANTAVATTLPAAVLALLSTSPGSSRRIPALHSQPYVRRGAHYAAGQALLALPPASVAAALEEGGGPLMDAIEAVWCVMGCIITQKRPAHSHTPLNASFTSAVAQAAQGKEPDGESGLLATAVLAARHALGEKAVHVMAAGEPEERAQISVHVPQLPNVLRVGM